MIPNFATERETLTELHEDINKFFKWENMCQMNFNFDKYFVMQIGLNSKQGNNSMCNQQLSATNQQRGRGIIITKDLKWKNQTK